MSWKTDKERLYDWATERATGKTQHQHMYECDSCGAQHPEWMLDFTAGLFGDSAECPDCGGAMHEMDHVSTHD
jgi:predicted RNA-binding Zn-ribbon protein involved in translation (DUF1610 family)